MNAFVPRFLFLSSCGALGALSLGGCFASDMDCDRNPMLRCGKWSVDAATGGNGGSGGGSTTPPGCVPSEDNAQVDADCGVFVSASKAPPTADGSPDSPYASLQDAINAGGNKPIYLCGEVFPATTATITLTAGRDVFGAMDCNDSWTYKPLAKSQLSGPANSPAMAISGKGTTTMADVSIEAPDATEAGASSIAMVVDGSVVTLERCALSAGTGKDGVDAKAAARATSGNPGAPGKVCANAGSVVTDPPQPLDCGGGEQSLGGAGGIGQNAQGTDGSKGTATPLTSSPADNGGDAQDGNNTCATGNGRIGTSGGNGTAPTASTAAGKLTSSGVTGIDGAAGTAAKPGQGGGGGGGGKGSALCTTNSNAGPSGGNGGQGGCGGLGGLGGQAGGSSIALISLKANVSLSSCTLAASDAGTGGKGAEGQLGGLGANGGGAATGACGGGTGGNGGQGGPGSGASGGHSLAIAHSGAPPSQDKVTATFASAPALGGKGAPSAPDGPAGQAKDILDFPNPT